MTYFLHVPIMNPSGSRIHVVSCGFGPPSQNNEENEEAWRRLSHGWRDGTLGSLFVPSLCPLSTAHCIAQRPPVPH